MVDGVFVPKDHGILDLYFGRYTKYPKNIFRFTLFFPLIKEKIVIAISCIEKNAQFILHFVSKLPFYVLF